jgi:hypothetical protein
MISSASITDPTFLRLESTQKTSYMTQGEAMWESLATKGGIDVDQVDDALYTPFRVETLCVLICMCRDLIGSDFRDSLTNELNELLLQLTPTMCGYEETGDTSGTGSMTISWERE